MERKKKLIILAVPSMGELTKEWSKGKVWDDTLNSPKLIWRSSYLHLLHWRGATEHRPRSAVKMFRPFERPRHRHRRRHRHRHRVRVRPRVWTVGDHDGRRHRRRRRWTLAASEAAVHALAGGLARLVVVLDAFSARKDNRASKVWTEPGKKS